LGLHDLPPLWETTSCHEWASSVLRISPSRCQPYN
jgi:hypothetical protein